MRRKDQAARRAQLTQAARQVLLERGAVGVRVKDVAERAGLAPSSVLYYYPSLDELLIEVSRGAIDRFAERRAAAVRRVRGHAEQLRLAIHLGVPSGPDDTESRLLYELDMNLLGLRSRHGETDETTGLTGVYHNLLRMWADT